MQAELIARFLNASRTSSCEKVNVPLFRKGEKEAVETLLSVKT